MTNLTRKAVTEALGELNDLTVAEIVAMDATREELAEAHAWLTNDEALINAGRALPTGRIGKLVELVRSATRSRRKRRERFLLRPAALHCRELIICLSKAASYAFRRHGAFQPRHGAVRNFIEDARA